MKLSEFKGDVPHVGRVNFTIYQDVTILAGGPGSGKTMTLKSVMELAKRKGIPFAYSSGGGRVRLNKADALSFFRSFLEKHPEFASTFPDFFEKKFAPEAHYTFSQKEMLKLISFLAKAKKEGKELIILDDFGNKFHPDWAADLISICRLILPKTQLVCATSNPALVMEDWFGQLIDVEMSEIKTAA